MSEGFTIEPGTTVNDVITELLKFPRDMTFSFGGRVIEHGMEYDHIPYLDFTRYSTSDNELSGEIMGLECFSCIECDETFVDTRQYAELGDRAPQPVHVIDNKILYSENDADAEIIHAKDDWENTLCNKCATEQVAESAGEDETPVAETEVDDLLHDVDPETPAEDFLEAVTDIVGLNRGNLRARIMSADGVNLITKSEANNIQASEVAANLAENRAFDTLFFAKPEFFECDATSVKWSRSGISNPGFILHIDFTPDDASELDKLRDYFEKQCQ